MRQIKRVVNTGFWSDDKVLDFTPEDKYFMLFLLTNEYVTQLGIYYLPIKKAAFDLGYSIEAVTNLIARFQSKHGILKYSEKTSEIALKNYLMHSIISGGKPVLDCLKQDMNAVKDKSLLGYVYDNLSQKDIENKTVKSFLEILGNYINNNNFNNDNDNDSIVDNPSTNRERIVNESSVPTKEPKIKRKAERYYEDEELNDAFAEFAKMRQKIKAPLTDKAITLAKNKLEELSGGDKHIKIAILNQSIMNSWKGVFPLHDDPKPESKVKAIEDDPFFAIYKKD